MVSSAPPIVQKLIKIGMSAVKQGTLAAGQTAVKTGGDAGATATSGLAAAGLSALTEGALSGASSAIASRASTAEKVGGVETTVPAEVRNAKLSPQQQAGQQSIRNAAKDTLKRNLQEFNEGVTPPKSAPALPAKSGPFEFNLRGQHPFEGKTEMTAQGANKFEPSAARVPEGQEPGAQNAAQLGSTAKTIPNRLQQRTQAFTSETGPAAADEARGQGTFTTQDPNIARAHIENLNKAIEGDDFANLSDPQKQSLLEARADAQRQMSAYHQHTLDNIPLGQTAIEPADIPKLISRTGSHTDAANYLERQAVNVYKMLDDVTGDKFSALKNENKEAWNNFLGASGEAKEAAGKALDSSNQKLQQMFDGLRGIVDARTLDAADDAFNGAQTLHHLAKAVDGSFSGNASASARSWEQRGFDGNTLMRNLSKLQQSMGRAKLDRFVGRENVDTLFQVAELNRTNAQRARFGQAIKPIGEALMRMHVGPVAAGGYLAHLVGAPWEAGAAAGWAGVEGSKLLMNAILTNPQAAKNLIYAIDYGAKPENYGPFIATLISKAASSSVQPQQ